MTNWAGQSAGDIAAAVRSGKVTAADVVAEHLEAIAARDTEIGAFIRVRSQAAAAEAAAVDARPDLAELPLAGVPVSVKDNIPVAGEALRFGSGANPGAPQAADHPLVARLRDAGAVVAGITNLPELAIFPFTDSAFGITRNPWDLSRTAGGSSGGAAASVAAGMVPIAHGTDGLGSIRVPAAACGLFGIKPGSGLLSYPEGDLNWFGLSESGPLATTVADAALMLGVLAGQSYSLDSPGRLRIAVSYRAPGVGIPVAKSCLTAVAETAALLAGLDHAVTDAEPPYPGWLIPVMFSYWTAGPASEAGPYAADMEPRTKWHVRVGRQVLRTRPPRAADRERLRKALAPFWADWDVLLLPTVAQPTPPARRFGHMTWHRSVATAIRFAPLTGAWNLAGYPAASVPAPADGMPGAVQIVTTPGREELLLRLAAQVERARPWPRHAPR
jgi:amidase